MIIKIKFFEILLNFAKILKHKLLLMLFNDHISHIYKDYDLVLIS